MKHRTQLLLVDYELDPSLPSPSGIPQGFTACGMADGSFPLCLQEETARLFMFHPPSNTLTELAPSIEAFLGLVEKFNGIDVGLPQDDYLQAVRGAISACDSSLLGGPFWGGIVEEIGHGIL